MKHDIQKNITLTVSGDSYWERLYKGRKLGIWLSSVVALVTLLIFAFTKTIKIVDTAQILEVLRVDVLGDGMKTSYSTFNMLSFVHKSELGQQGLYAMVLFGFTLVTLFLNIYYVIRGQKIKSNQSNIKTYEIGQYAMVSNIVLSLGIILFSIYSNQVLELSHAFSYSLLLYVVILLSVAAFVVIKKMEAPERRLYKEPGFFKEFRRNWVLFLLLVPAILFFAVNCYLPMAGMYFAFEKFNFRDGLWSSKFVMFDNFKYIWRADLFKLVKNTVLYNLVFIILGHAFKIFIAILISQLTGKWFKRINQTLIFMPHFVSYVILSVIVYNALNFETGAINTFLTSIGFDRIDFYNTPSYWPFIIVFFELWKGVGYGSVVYLAAILGIDKSLYEAAEVDGANIFQQISYITLPNLKPTFIILILFSLGNIMRGQFDLFYQTVGNNGLLYNTTDIFDTYVYRLTMTNPLNNGLGTAAGLFQSIFGFITIMITNIIVKRKNEDYALF